MGLNDDEKREKLKKILLELSNSQDVLSLPKACEEYNLRLEEIYADPKFRHFYSDIFSLLTQIDNEGQAGSIEILAQNIGVLRKEYKEYHANQNQTQQGNTNDISRGLDKLYDHVNLDIARINYVKAITVNMISQDRIDETDTRIDQLGSSIDKVEDEMRAAQDDLKNSQRDSVAILGIFAAIVLAFTGGLVFSTSVLENMAGVSIYRLLLVALLIAFTIINIIAILLNFIGKITLKENDPSVDVQKVNIAIIIGAVLVFIAWCVNKA